MKLLLLLRILIFSAGLMLITVLIGEAIIRLGGGQ